MTITTLHFSNLAEDHVHHNTSNKNPPHRLWTVTNWSIKMWIMNWVWRKLWKYLIPCQTQDGMTTVMASFINLLQCWIKNIQKGKIHKITHKIKNNSITKWFKRYKLHKSNFLALSKSSKQQKILISTKENKSNPN